jgi:hypothetical protein
VQKGFELGRRHRHRNGALAIPGRLISGRPIALLISALSLSTIGFGVPAGATMPIQITAS